jgi:hypothetical protein
VNQTPNIKPLFIPFMKYLIPVSFTLSGAYLLGLPLRSHTEAVEFVSRVASPSAGPLFSPFPYAPYLFIVIPWLAGGLLIAVAIVLAFRSYRTDSQA